MSDNSVSNSDNNNDNNRNQKGNTNTDKINEERRRMKNFVPNRRKFLSSGKFGKIYLVEDHPKYVIKEITCQKNTILMEEHPILIKATQECENILAIQESIWKPKLDVIWVIMDKLQGSDLFDVISDDTNFYFTNEKIISITKQLLTALEYLHKNGIIHMDVKPENIRVIENKKNINSPIIKLYDFGLSKFVSSTQESKFIGGTPGFIAPEVLKFKIEGDSTKVKITELVDIWSLGATLFEILTGKIPHEVLKIDEYNYISLSRTDKIKKRLKYVSYNTIISKICLNMLEYNYQFRPGAKELLNYHIFQVV